MICISLPYDPEWLALAWAKEYCPSYINNGYSSYSSEDNTIDYYFYDERDAVMFALRWS